MRTDFEYIENYPIDKIDFSDERYKSRIDRARWEKQIKVLMEDMKQRGQIDPIGIAKISGEDSIIRIYGFTRSEAIRRLGWDTIRVNYYEDLNEHDASILNATNNSMHNPLTNWERALQIKRMKKDGVKVESSDENEDTITSIYGISRRCVFQWLQVVDYDCPELHRAIADESIGLKHALEFVDYPPELTIEMLEKCIEEEWTSKILGLKLKSATVAQEEGLSGKSNSESATVAQTDKVEIKRNLDKAANMILESKIDDILSLSSDKQIQLNKGLRMILEVLL